MLFFCSLGSNSSFQKPPGTRHIGSLKRQRRNVEYSSARLFSNTTWRYQCSAALLPHTHATNTSIDGTLMNLPGSPRRFHSSNSVPTSSLPCCLVLTFAFLNKTKKRWCFVCSSCHEFSIFLNYYILLKERWTLTKGGWGLPIFTSDCSLPSVWHWFLSLLEKS